MVKKPLTFDEREELLSHALVGRLGVSNDGQPYVVLG